MSLTLDSQLHHFISILYIYQTLLECTHAYAALGHRPNEALKHIQMNTIDIISTDLVRLKYISVINYTN